MAGEEGKGWMKKSGGRPLHSFFWGVDRGWVWGGRLLTVVCMHEPNLPPSAVRVRDVRATEAPGPPSFSLPPSLSSQAMSCCQPTYACLQWRGGVGVVWGSGGGDRGTWAASVFFLSPSTLVFLPVRRWCCSLLTPPAPPRPLHALCIWITSEAPLSWVEN